MEQDRRRVHGEVLCAGLAPACTVLALLFVGFAVWHPLALAGGDGAAMGVLAAGTAAAFAGCAALARRGQLPARRAHAVATGLVGLAFSDCAVQYVLTEQEFLSVNVLLVMIGAGLCLVDRRWTVVAVGLCGLGWLAVVTAVTGVEAGSSALLNVALGAGVAGLAHVVRLGTLDRLLDVQDELRALSQRDELTGLLNRRGFLESAHALLERRPLRLWFLDVDGLKAVNDSRGHDVGDVLLIAVAAALRDVFAGGVVARLSGDEFAVVEDHGAADGLERAERALRKRLVLAGQVTGLEVSVSTGTAVATPGSRLSDVLSAADAAMYADKQARRTIRLPEQGRPPVVLPAVPPQGGPPVVPSPRPVLTPPPLD